MLARGCCALLEQEEAMFHTTRVLNTGEISGKLFMQDHNIKQVILYRRDLKMRKGKIAAQVAHASMRVLLMRGKFDPARPLEVSITMTPEMAVWVQHRFTKIVLSVESEADLLLAHEEALARGLPTSLITDAGRTEFHGQPTHTTVAIGPANAEDIDAITGREGIVSTKLA